VAGRCDDWHLLIAREQPLYLIQLFRTNPLLALALLICLVTILCCILLARRQRNHFDRALTGLLGLIAIYESLRILKDSGFVIFKRFHTPDGWVDFISACLYLVAALILKTSNVDRVATGVHVRLMEADEKPLNLANAIVAAVPELGQLVDSSPLAIFAIDLRGAVIYFNPAAEILTGWSRRELMGHHLPFDLRGPIQSKTGNPIECAIWIVPIRTARGPSRGQLITAAGRMVLRDAGLDWSPSRTNPTFAVER
jgi:PAS domain-containing protein